MQFLIEIYPYSLYPALTNLLTRQFFLSWKCCLLFKSAACNQVYFGLIFSWKQTIWTQIRLLLREQSDLGPYCLQYRLPRNINRCESKRQNRWLAGKELRRYWVIMIYCSYGINGALYCYYFMLVLVNARIKPNHGSILAKIFSVKLWLLSHP